MAIGSPFHERSWSPAEPISQATPGEREGRGPGLGTPAEGALDLGLVVAAIQDGLLMVFGPDDDPIPPQVFGAAAAEQPDAAVRLVDGPAVRAERIAAVLDAQTGGRLGSDRGGEEAWIRAMLGVGPQAEMAGADDLLAEGSTREVDPSATERTYTIQRRSSVARTTAKGCDCCWSSESLMSDSRTSPPSSYSAPCDRKEVTSSSSSVPPLASFMWVRSAAVGS